MLLKCELKWFVICQSQVSTQFRAYPCFRALYQCPKGYVLNI